MNDVTSHGSPLTPSQQIVETAVTGMQAAGSMAAGAAIAMSQIPSPYNTGRTIGGAPLDSPYGNTKDNRDVSTPIPGTKFGETDANGWLHQKHQDPVFVGIPGVDYPKALDEINTMGAAAAFPDVASGQTKPFARREGVNMAMRPMTKGEQFLQILIAAYQHFQGRSSKAPPVLLFPDHLMIDQELLDRATDELLQPSIQAALYAQNETEEMKTQRDWANGILDKMCLHFGPTLYLDDEGDFSDRPILGKLPSMVCELNRRYESLSQGFRTLGQFLIKHVKGLEGASLTTDSGEEIASVKVVAVVMACFGQFERKMDRSKKRIEHLENRGEERGQALDAIARAMGRANGFRPEVVVRVVEDYVTVHTLFMQQVALIVTGESTKEIRSFDVATVTPEQVLLWVTNLKSAFDSVSGGLQASNESLGGPNAETLAEQLKVIGDHVHRMGMCVIGTPKEAHLRYASSYVLDAVTGLHEKHARQEETILEQQKVIETQREAIKAVEGERDTWKREYEVTRKELTHCHAIVTNSDAGEPTIPGTVPHAVRQMKEELEVRLCGATRPRDTEDHTQAPDGPAACNCDANDNSTKGKHHQPTCPMSPSQA